MLTTVLVKKHFVVIIITATSVTVIRLIRIYF